ncbi:MAG: hypothetical protein KCHDKBKB_02984 [Elusimicrobia bacterium]|nr:hypothetical protein [Elusimicrobiota bacterium]
MFICGKRGSGKTELAKRIITRNAIYGVTYVVIDPLSHYEKNSQFTAHNIIVNPSRFRIERNAINVYKSRNDVELFITNVMTKERSFFLVVDEIDMILPNNGAGINPIMHELIHYGRHYDIALLGTARRIQNVHKDYLSGCDRLFLFRMWAHRDIKIIEENASKEVAQKVRNLREHQYLNVNMSTGEYAISRLNFPR